MSHSKDNIDIPLWTNAMAMHPLASLTECSITSVEHWKHARNLGHEFLIISFRNDDYERYIKLERGAKRSGSLSDFTESILSMGGPVDPNDLIAISVAPFDTTACFTVKVLDFSHGIPPNIADLASVLNAVRDKAPKYRLYKHMCYWYARAVFEGLAYLCHGHTLDGEKPGYRGRFCRLIDLSCDVTSPDNCNAQGCPGQDMKQQGNIQSHVLEFRRHLIQHQRQFYDAERAAVPGIGEE